MNPITLRVSAEKKKGTNFIINTDSNDSQFGILGSQSDQFNETRKHDSDSPIFSELSESFTHFFPLPRGKRHEAPIISL